MKLKKAGIINLAVGVIISLCASLLIRFLTGRIFIYTNSSLFNKLYDETAIALVVRNIVPGMFLLVIFYCIMYCSYAFAIDEIDPGVAARERRHAVIPGCLLCAAEVLLLLVMVFLSAGCLSIEELINENIILYAYAKAGILSAAAEVVLYVVLSVLLKPNRLKGKG